MDGVESERNQFVRVTIIGPSFWYWFSSEGLYQDDFLFIVKFHGPGMSTAQKYHIVNDNNLSISNAFVVLCFASEVSIDCML